MSVLKPKPATYADIEALPPNMVGEILFGSLVTHPRPAPRHAAAASHMGGVLTQPFDAITFSLGLLWPFDPPADSNL